MADDKIFAPSMNLFEIDKNSKSSNANCVKYQSHKKKSGIYIVCSVSIEVYSIPADFIQNKLIDLNQGKSIQLNECNCRTIRSRA